MSQYRFWEIILWYLWICRGNHPGGGNFWVEVFDVGGRLTHVDFALKTRTDFLAVTEHRLLLGFRMNGLG